MPYGHILDAFGAGLHNHFKGKRGQARRQKASKKGKKRIEKIFRGL